jgi:hypothetical protein
LDYEVIWYATSMPGDAPSIQPGEIAHSIESFAQAAAVGMVVVPSRLMTANRETIAALAGQLHP